VCGGVADSIAYKFGGGGGVGRVGGGIITLRLRDQEIRDRRRDTLALGFSTTNADAVLLRVASTSSTDFIQVELVRLPVDSVLRFYQPR